MRALTVAAVLALSCAARAADVHATVVVGIDEPDQGDSALKVGPHLLTRLKATGWVVSDRTDGPHCTIRGALTSSRIGAYVFAQYELEALTESGASMASLKGQINHVHPSDARDEIVNVFMSRLLAALASHAMPDTVIVRGVENDEQVQALRAMLAVAARVPAVESDHFSNGELTLAIKTPRPAHAVAEPLAGATPAGKKLEIDYAGVDLLVARLH